MTHQQSTRWLRIASLTCAAVGLAMAFALPLGAQSLMAWFLDLAFLPLDQAQAFSDPSAHLLGAISGGLLFGFGVMSYQITTHVYANDPAIGGRILRWGIISWFLVDCTGSVLAGAWFNVILNSGFLALFLIPIARASKSRSALA
ncbi:excinuclease ABC subunit A [Shimia sp.]|uniref:excinuclease ABC subunit A n=1 Tax=Shimia sp. TaxID=1954381 RepID=UPI0032988B2D